MRKENRSQAASIHTAVWLIGLGILWLTDFWWPGILILIGISMIVQAVVPKPAREDIPAPAVPAEAVKETPAETKDETQDAWAKEEADETPAFLKPAPSMNSARLPKACPACGGPVRENAHKVEWIDDNNAKCPFCDTRLILT